MCAAFIDAVKNKKEWVAYPETAGFDILLVRASDGCQIGIEAKLVLNPKVVAQVLPLRSTYGVVGPDYRAVLVPETKCGNELSAICAALGITVIHWRGPSASPYVRGPLFHPDLPSSQFQWIEAERWVNWCPAQRERVPEFVPDVSAGASGPLKLSEWKIKAIKIAVLLETRPVTRADFKAIGIDPSRWVDPRVGWLERTEAGYVARPGMPDFRAQHPKNYEEIRDALPRWIADVEKARRS